MKASIKKKSKETYEIISRAILWEIFGWYSTRISEANSWYIFQAIHARFSKRIPGEPSEVFRGK